MVRKIDFQSKYQLNNLLWGMLFCIQFRSKINLKVAWYLSQFAKMFRRHQKFTLSKFKIATKDATLWTFEFCPNNCQYEYWTYWQLLGQNSIVYLKICVCHGYFEYIFVEKCILHADKKESKQNYPMHRAITKSFTTLK